MLLIPYRQNNVIISIIANNNTPGTISIILTNDLKGQQKCNERMDPFIYEKAKTSVIHTKDLLMVSLAKFFSDKMLIRKVMSIISGESIISLRLIDWFVTNYSKKYGTIIVQAPNQHFNVYLSYRSQLKAYSKQQFDPFRRRDRIRFYYERDMSTETTIGQLNFFRWVLENNILEYIEEHKETIESDMILVQKENTKRKVEPDSQQHTTGDPNTRKKRNELSASFIKNMNTFGGLRTITFD